MRFYRFLLRFLPAAFRSDFADAMRADTEAMPAPRWWTLEIPSVLAAIVREHLDALGQDVKYSLRLMRRTPGFTALAVIMLALGTGVNAAMFSVVDAVMLRSPFKNPEQLASVRAVDSRGGTALVEVARLPELLSSPAIAAAALLTGGGHTVTGLGDPRPLDNVECVSASMFGVLRTPPLLGRTFDAAEDAPGASPAVVLSYTFWKEIGGSPEILGSSLTINTTPVTVIGVMPRGFYGAQARPDTQAWLPYHRPIKNAENTGCRQSPEANVVARLSDGLTREAAQARRPAFQLEVLESVWMESVRTPLLVLTGAVACVLLIACFNVGGLQMERTLARRREFALRLSLGAARGRLVRQIIAENVVFALVGAVAGVAATFATMQALVSILPPNLPYLAEITVNARVVLVTIGAAAAAGLFCGIFPILESRRFSAAEGLGAGARATGANTGWTRRGLVVAEIALSIVVLIGAALMIQTFITLRPSSPGFDPDHKLWQPARLRGAAPEVNARFYRDLFDRLRVAPGIRAVAGTTYVPMIRISGNATLTLGGAPVRVLSNTVTPNYFTVMKIPMAGGRAFTAGDTAGSLPVVVVNDVLARGIAPGGQAIGQRIVMKTDAMGLPGSSERTIVGVIANTRSSGVDTGARSEAYLPHAQNPGASQTLIVHYLPGRSAEAAASVRAAIRELRPDFVFTPPRELRAMVDAQVATPRFGAWLLGLFAGLSVLLAGIGLMTTIGWWVNQRSRELGVRMALGATSPQILRLVAGQGLALAAFGVGLGCASAAGLTRYMKSFIYGITPIDPLTFSWAALCMLAIAASAIYLPVRRALRLDPVTILRAE